MNAKRFEHDSQPSIFTPETELSALFHEVHERLALAKIALVLDVDETLVLSVRKWTEQMNALFYTRLKLLQEPLSFEEVCARGGTYGSFGSHPDIPQPLFERATQRRLGSKRFNTHLPIVEDNIQAVLAELEQAGMIVGMYLTARPDSVTEVTRQEMLRLGFPAAPVLARPKHISEPKIAQWKHEQLSRVAQASTTPVVMVDDSVKMADHIIAQRALNPNDSTAQRIHPLVYRGVRTGYTNGHTVAESWQEMSRVLEQFGEHTGALEPNNAIHAEILR